ncbi:MAG: OmpA family protein [Myxococcales bacterium]|nr:OmpA family protein [Myxococcales bacterium]
MRRTSINALVVAAVLPLLAGCPGSTLKKELSGIKQTIDSARKNGAYLCAPVELAMAESHYAFTAADLYYGDYFSAKDHIAITKDNADKALAKSPADRCAYKEEKAVIVPKSGDADGDGIKDELDKCPDEPEDKDGFEDEDGCPELDNDKDGIYDSQDKCPNDPEDKDGFEDTDGCPDPDNDKDGVLDKDDKCPMQPGPKENQGCPDTDKDKDTVVDRLDKCPDDPGPPSNAGCPEKKYITITQEKIELKRQVQFATAKAIINKDSFELLDEVVELLKKNPQIKLRIEGHTDTKGKPAKNLVLSRDRAKAVMDYLTKGGIDASRLSSEGYGQTCPVADNATEQGREKNRRTDFFLAEPGAVSKCAVPDPKTGLVKGAGKAAPAKGADAAPAGDDKPKGKKKGKKKK